MREVQKMKRSSEEIRKRKDKIKKGAGRAAGWLVLVLICMIAVPVGFVMLILSGIWSLADNSMD